MIALAIFGTEFAYAIEAAAKRANRDANCDYSDALGFGSPKQQDDAFAACQRTGRLADQAADAVIECEDALWTRAGSRKHFNRKDMWHDTERSSTCA